MKKTSSKLFLAAAALGLAAASTIGSTYAWFTVNGSANISGVNMTVEGGSGIMIKKHDETTFGTTIAVNDTTGKTWDACTPSTTGNLSSFKTLDLAATLSNGSSYQYKTVSVGTSSTKNYYYTLDLDVRVTSGYDFNVSVSDVSDDSGAAANCKAANVIRVGFIHYGDDNTSVASYSICGITNGSGTANNYALTSFNAVFGTSITVSGTPTAPTNIAGESTSQKVEVKSTTAANGYCTQRVGIVVWYDGDDFQCSDDIFNKSVSFKLNFTPVAKAS